MSRYYLMAQLPSLDGLADSAPLPITEVDFLELCRRLLGKKEVRELEGLTLVPNRDGESSDSALVAAWNEGERLLRLALGAVRAERMNKQFDTGVPSVPSQLMEKARAAVEYSDPLEAEVFLHRVRLGFLESLRPMDPFSEDAVLYYGLKLKLMSRMRSFDGEQGRMAYERIYRSVINGSKREAL